jgi:hypothetical protein
MEDSQNQPASINNTLIILLASLILLPTLLFMLLYATTPGDGTRLAFNLPPPPSGIRLERYIPKGSGVLPEIYLLAIEDQHVDELLIRLLEDPLSNGISPSTGSLNYTVSGAERSQDIHASLKPSTLWAVIKKDWSYFLSFLFLLTVSFLLFIRRPYLPAARVYFLLSSIIVASGSIYFIGVRANDLLNGPVFWLWIWCVLPLYGLLVGCTLHFALVFPRPRDILRKHPVFLPLVYLIPWLPYLVMLLLLWPVYPSPSQRMNLIMESTGLMTLTGFVLAILIAVQGYRTIFSSKERRQTRWVLWGVLIASVPWLIITVVPALLGNPVPNLPIIGVLWWAIPISFVIAILRENLFDIDIIINRTLVYGALTATLVLAYFCSVVVLQELFVAISGQESAVAVVISTLVIAALFNPLRRRIQNTIDRRFYRRKYDAEKVVEAFSAGLREEVDIEQLSERLLAVVEETLEPESLSLWLKEE